MKNLCLFIILLLVLPLVYFSSCAEEENRETENPKVEYAKINVNDTVSYYVSTVRINVKVNDSTKVKAEAFDTLVIGKYIYINAGFSDNEGLSSFKVELTLTYKDKRGTSQDPNRPLAKDSIHRIVKLGQDIFGKQSAQVYRNRMSQIPDTLIRTKADGSRDTLALDQKGSTGYQLKVACIDMSRNGDSIYIPVRLVYRKDIIRGSL